MNGPFVTLFKAYICSHGLQRRPAAVALLATRSICGTSDGVSVPIFFGSFLQISQSVCIWLIIQRNVSFVWRCSFGVIKSKLSIQFSSTTNGGLSKISEGRLKQSIREDMLYGYSNFGSGSSNPCDTLMQKTISSMYFQIRLYCYSVSYLSTGWFSFSIFGLANASTIPLLLVDVVLIPFGP